MAGHPIDRLSELIGSGGSLMCSLNYFAPDETTDLDFGTTAYSWKVTTRSYATGRYVANTVVKLRASYQLQDKDGFDPTIQAYMLTSRPSTRTVGRSGSVLICNGKLGAAEVTAWASVRSIPRSRHHQVRARYIAPVSR